MPDAAGTPEQLEGRPVYSSPNGTELYPSQGNMRPWSSVASKASTAAGKRSMISFRQEPGDQCCPIATTNCTTADRCIRSTRTTASCMDAVRYLRAITIASAFQTCHFCSERHLQPLYVNNTRIAKPPTFDALLNVENEVPIIRKLTRNIL